jgi:glutathionyl-hydroquinone reductase
VTPAARTYVEERYERDMRYLADRITVDGRDGWPVEPGRYRLVVSRACPWANRAIIVRRLLGLEDALPMGSPARPTTPTAGPSTSTPAGWTRCSGSRG